MIRKQILFKIIKDAAEISGNGCVLEDLKGKVIASFGTLRGNCACQEVLAGMQSAYVVKVYGDDPSSAMVAKLLKSQIEILLTQTKKERSQQDCVDAIIKGDADAILQGRQNSLTDKKWQIYVIREESRPERTEKFLKDFYRDSNNVVIGYDPDDNIVLVDMDADEENDGCDNAKVLLDLITMEAMASVNIGFGAAVDEAVKCQNAYKQAVMALEIGSRFYPEEKIYSYRKLGIGRLIASVSDESRRMYAEEIFGDCEETLTEEEILTAKAFFECNLNISETARQLYVHRNSLLYRLDKIQKKIGLDIRQFDDAVKLKLAMMARIQ